MRQGKFFGPFLSVVRKKFRIREEINIRQAEGVRMEKIVEMELSDLVCLVLKQKYECFWNYVSSMRSLK